MPFNNGFNLRSGCVATLFSLIASMACEGDSVLNYQVPKTIPVLPKTVSAPATPAVGASKPLTWTVPKGWVEQPVTGMRIGQFTVPGSNNSKAELAITAFSGLVGDELSNINRWRAEIGLSPIQATDITSEQVTIGTAQGKLYQFTAPQKSTLVAWLVQEETSWFFKLRGDTLAVTEAKSAMVDFLKSIQFVAPPTVDTGNAVNPMSAVDPHTMDTSVSNLPAGHPSVARAAENALGLAPVVRQPDWDIPTTWQEQPATRLVLKSFQASNSKGKVTATISAFPGEVGGLAANINRWRGQIGLDELKDSDTAQSSETVQSGNDKGTLVNFLGKDGKTRLIAVYLPHGNATWFYKLQGDDAAVEAEKANLLKVLKSVRYP